MTCVAAAQQLCILSNVKLKPLSFQPHAHRSEHHTPHGAQRRQPAARANFPRNSNVSPQLVATTANGPETIEYMSYIAHFADT